MENIGAEGLKMLFRDHTPKFNAVVLSDAER